MSLCGKEKHVEKTRITLLIKRDYLKQFRYKNVVTLFDTFVLYIVSCVFIHSFESVRNCSVNSLRMKNRH